MSEGDDARVGWRDALVAIVLAGVWVAVVRPGPLSLAYFWDEADVYVPGARWVAEHGLDVTPGVFPDDYSRGHPPLLYLIAAIAFRLFGAEPAVGHLVVLPFTVIALAGTYLLGAALWSRAAGASAALLLAATPLAMSIGNMLLPEMPLTALAVLSLLAFARGRLGLAVLCGVLAVWIKETGIFAAAAVGVGVLADAHRRRTLRDAATWWRAGLAALPLVALLAFFAWQKTHAGYYVFPHHQSLFADRPLGAQNLLTVWPSLLLWHGRWIVIAAALGALALGRRVRPLRVEERWRPKRSTVVAACLALVLFNAIFFTKMFWLERYALPAHPGLLVCACGALFAGFARVSSERARSAAAYAAVVAAALAGVLSMRAPAPPDAEEHTFAYADVVATHRRAFAALGEQDAPVLTTWPMTVELREPYLGYVERPLATVNARHFDADEDRVASILINTASGRASELRAEALRRGMRRVAVFREGVAPPLELYRPAERP